MSDAQSVVEIGWKSFALFGGIGAVISAASSWLTSYLSSRWIEKYKSALTTELEKIKHSLKRDEALFERDFSASTDWYQLKLSTFPKYMIDPDYDEMLDSMSMKLGIISSDLYGYLVKHGAVLPSDIRERITNLAFSMGSEDANVAQNNGATTESRKLIGELFEYFPVAQTALDRRVRLSDTAG